MPYVEVWVDSEPCDGDCGYASDLESLEARVDEAVKLLRLGYTSEAFQVLTDDGSLPCKSPREIASKYYDWKSGKLPGFEPPMSTIGEEVPNDPT